MVSVPGIVLRNRKYKGEFVFVLSEVIREMLNPRSHLFMLNKRLCWAELHSFKSTAS